MRIIIRDQKQEREDTAEGLDMSQAAVKKMINEARQRGYITYDQLNQVLPPDQVASEQIEDVMSMLSEMGINIIEEEEAEDDGTSKEVATTNQAKDVVLATSTTEALDRTDDPVRMYLREMGSVELLSREGEIAIAKRIEAGRKTMIEGLCESPLTFQAITIWRDELLSEDILPSWKKTAKKKTSWLPPVQKKPRARKTRKSSTPTATLSQAMTMMTMTRMNRPTCPSPPWKLR